MAAQDFHQEQVDENSTDHNQLQDPYESEETLSLCDLSLNGNIESDHWDFPDHFSKSPQISSSDQDFFDFFTHGFSAASPSPTQKNIIFCGKLIPYREPEFKPQNPKKNSIFRRKSADSYTKLKPSSSSFHNSKISEDYRFSDRKFSIGKVSVFAGRSRSRWCLFMFGMSKFSIEMDLGDIRTRQNRRRPETMFRPFDGGEAAGDKKRRGRKGFWWLLRAMGCRSGVIQT